MPETDPDVKGGEGGGGDTPSRGGRRLRAAMRGLKASPPNSIEEALSPEQITATAQSYLDESVATFKALTGAKTLKDAFDLQAAYVRSALEKTLESGFAHIPVAIHPAEQEIHYAVEQLDEAAGELAAIAQRAVEAAQKRGDEIDAMLADIRRFRAA